MKTYIEYLRSLSKNLYYLNKSLYDVESNGTRFIDGLSNKFNKAIFENFFGTKPHFDFL